jgi:hypothetical protein
MNAARLNDATPDVEPGIAVGEADEAAVGDIDVVALRLGRPATGLG